MDRMTDRPVDEIAREIVCRAVGAPGMFMTFEELISAALSTERERARKAEQERDEEHERALRFAGADGRNRELRIAAEQRAERFREALIGLTARFRDHSNMEATPPWCRYVDHRQELCACDEIAAEIERALQPDTEEGKP